MSGSENRQLLQEEPGPTCWDSCKSGLQTFLGCCLGWLSCPGSDPSYEAVTVPKEGCGAHLHIQDKEPVLCKSGAMWLAWLQRNTVYLPDFYGVFPVQIRKSGKTGGCERHFVLGVSRLLSKQPIALIVEESTETSSKDLLLLVFCPIASRMGTDIESALQGLSGDRKAILVVMHHLPKDNTETFLDVNQHVTHPAVVLTVHTRYTLQSGFYLCEMNQRAMVDVAATIKGLAEDQ